MNAAAILPSLVITLPFEPRSLALFVSAQTEKIMYLEQPLKSQVLIDSAFRIRDLTIGARKETILNKFINLK